MAQLALRLGEADDTQVRGWSTRRAQRSAM